MTLWLIAAAALAGGFGAGLRYLVDVLVVGARPSRFPLGILIVNVTGSFALGVLTGIGASIVGAETASIVGIGLLGGYTTFSTVSVESVLMVQSGEARRGWLNVVGTLVLGVAAATVGVSIGLLY